MSNEMVAQENIPTVISNGSYGTVYKYDNLAVKAIDLFDYYGYREIIMRALISDHKFIIPFNDIEIVKDNVLQITMPLYENTLHKFIVKNGASLLLKQKILLATNVARAVNHIHKCNVVHLDLKSTNIMVNNINDIAVIDFGMAAINNSNNNNVVPQTPGYGAPENTRDANVTFGMDVWSVGCILFEILFGAPFISIELYNNLLINKITASHYNMFAYQYGAKTNTEKLYKLMYLKAAELYTSSTYLKTFINLIVQCLDIRPTKRITSLDLAARLYDLYSAMDGYRNHDIVREIHNNMLIFPSHTYKPFGLKRFYDQQFLSQDTKRDMQILYMRYGALDYSDKKIQHALIYIISTTRNYNNEALDFGRFLYRLDPKIYKENITTEEMNEQVVRNSFNIIKDMFYK